MRTLVLVMLVAAFVVAPALAFTPQAEACQPYSYYCPIDGRIHYGCGSKVPSSCVMTILDP